MGTFNSIASALGMGSNVVNVNPSDDLDKINTTAQIGASTTALTDSGSPSSFIATTVACETAFSTASMVLANDFKEKKPFSDKVSDGTTMVGDMFICGGAIVAANPTPAAKVAGKWIEAGGIILTIAGTGIKNREAIVKNTPIALGEAGKQLDEWKEKQLNDASYDLINKRNNLINKRDDLSKDFHIAFGELDAQTHERIEGAKDTLSNYIVYAKQATLAAFQPSQSPSSDRGK